jgi:membrane protein implicated in regulation of membrane protease activity
VTAFLVIGGFGLLVLAIALVFGDALDGLLPGTDLGDGLFSLPALAGAVAAFGFGGAAILATGAPSVAALVVGAVAAVAMAWFVVRLTRAVLHMPTDEVVRKGDLVGRPARVVSAVPTDGMGEVVVRSGGQSVKLSARSARPLPVGSEVVVVDELSHTSVLVEPAEEFWEGTQ